MKKTRIIIITLVLLGILYFPPINASETVRFAVIGDYGTDSGNEAAVANLVKSWNVDFVITTGDNRQKLIPLSRSVGKYYGGFMASGDFYPTMGNHDDNPDEGNYKPYTDYFDLPGNERYYDFTRGPVHFTCINSESKEPDGINAKSKQANWARSKVAGSNAPWEIAYFHFTTYTSNARGPSTRMRNWNFGKMGVDAVFSGHMHLYERVHAEGALFFTNGVGGGMLYSFSTPIAGSMKRVREYGAQLVTATSTSIRFQFINVNGVVRDDYTLTKSDTPKPEPEIVPKPTPTPSGSYTLQIVAVPGGRLNLAPGLHTFPAGTMVKVRIQRINSGYGFTRYWVLDGVRQRTPGWTLYVKMDSDHTLKPIFRRR